MIAAILLMLAAQAEPPAAPPGDDIVVTGQRLRQLKRLRMVIQADHKTGERLCVFRRRSGDPRLDTLICDAALACDATTEKTIAAVRACMAPTMDPLTKGVPWRATTRRAD